uniref:Hypotheticial protein n=1 Tax=Schistosoma japonicum TaxID=6182 RepID=C1LPK4_SCHJA|nr:hypotheticial protein [Schistosoma japonicum]
MQLNHSLNTLLFKFIVACFIIFILTMKKIHSMELHNSDNDDDDNDGAYEWNGNIFRFERYD